jgi:hypothetical protein
LKNKKNIFSQSHRENTENYYFSNEVKEQRQKQKNKKNILSPQCDLLMGDVMGDVGSKTTYMETGMLVRM